MNTPTRPRRLARLIAALVAFVATSAALHAVANQQGWRTGHHGYAWQHERCNDTLNPGNGASKPAL